MCAWSIKMMDMEEDQVTEHGSDVEQDEHVCDDA